MGSGFSSARILWSAPIDRQVRFEALQNPAYPGSGDQNDGISITIYSCQYRAADVL
jgi:hypothetical protein